MWTNKPKHASTLYRCGGVRASARSSTEIPRQWYNLIADLPIKPPPPLHPKTFQPINPEDLSHLFPDELIKQEASSERYIDIPDEVIDVYQLWRPTPLIRSVPILIESAEIVHCSSFLDIRSICLTDD